MSINQRKRPKDSYNWT